MSGCYSYVWLFLFTVVVIETLGVTVQTGLYSRVELTGENLDQQTRDSITQVDWTKLNKTSTCLCLVLKNDTAKSYSKCCGGAHFYLHNNSLILENVTAHVEGVFRETIVTANGSTKSFNFTLNILYPPNATGILISWSSNNTSVSLTCEVNWNFTDIMWKKEESPILEDNRHSFSGNNQTLHISNIASSDYRKYSCVATNAYGQSETQTYITNEEHSTQSKNTTHKDDDNLINIQTIQNFILSGLAISILALCIILFYVVKRCSHGRRRDDSRTTEGIPTVFTGDVDTGFATYQEIPGTAEVSLLPYVYTDFIKPRQAHQNSAAAENTEDFGYSEIGPAVRGKSDEQSTPCPNTGEE